MKTSFFKNIQNYFTRRQSTAQIKSPDMRDSTATWKESLNPQHGAKTDSDTLQTKVKRHRHDNVA